MADTAGGGRNTFYDIVRTNTVITVLACQDSG